MAQHLTMLELVRKVAETTNSDAEIVATVTRLVNSDAVCLCGTFRGRHIDLDGLGEGPGPR